MQLLAPFVLSAVIVSTISAAANDVWWWFSTCGGPMMTVEVKVQGITVNKVTMPLCRAPRAQSNSQGDQARIDFSFRPTHPVEWKGYREGTDRTNPGQVIEGALWQAGAEADGVLTGVSFSTPNRILMNTIHIAHPDRRDESTIADGLTIATYPGATGTSRGRGRDVP
jgi:hypothetical protein